MPAFTKNQAPIASIALDMRDASGAYVAGIPIVAVSVAGAAYASYGGTLSAIPGATGEWEYLPSQAEVNAGKLKVRAALSGAVTITREVFPEPDYSADRAARLDAAVSSRSTYAGADTPGTATLLSRVGGPLTITGGRVDVNDRTGFSLVVPPPTATQVRQELDANSMRLANLDATVSSRSTYGGGDPSGVSALLARVTAARAAALDNLDVPVGSRSTLGVADVWGYATRTVTGGASCISAADVTNALTAQGLTSARAARLDNLDAAVSSRNAVAPDNAGVAAIRERAARLPDVPAAVGSAMRLDLTQAVPTSNAANSVGDTLNAARAQGFGSWRVIGGELHLYGPDGATIVQSFTLDNSASPSRRIAA